MRHTSVIETVKGTTPSAAFPFSLRNLALTAQLGVISSDPFYFKTHATVKPVIRSQIRSVLGETTTLRLQYHKSALACWEQHSIAIEFEFMHPRGRDTCGPECVASCGATKAGSFDF